MTDYTQIQVRQDTSARWASINPILLAGEFGYATDTKVLKKGDGTTAWNSLPEIAEKATTLAGYGITDGADTALSNLSSDGQMVIDSQNGTISNCILEIPQNLKLTLENNVLTLKSGSILTKTGDTYTTVTTTQDITFTVSDNDNVYVIFSNNRQMQMIWIKYIGSGSTLPSDNSNYYYFYNTTDKLMYHWASNSWSTAAPSYYPICLIEISNGVASFVKDSNGNDMIFNGAGFIGQHAFVYPGVKGLQANGINTDGSLNSNSFTTNSLQIVKFSIQQTDIVHDYTNNAFARRAYIEGYDSSSTPANYTVAYDEKTNNLYMYNGSWALDNTYCLFIHYVYNGTTVTDFVIRQPVRTATVEMLKDKQNDLTTVSGYDATATQVLKNINGVLTWVTEE